MKIKLDWNDYKINLLLTTLEDARDTTTIAEDKAGEINSLIKDFMRAVIKGE